MERVAAWSISAVGGAPVFDPLAATIVWGLSIWLVNGWAGWAVRRWREPLWAVTPSACLVGLSLASVRGPTLSLLIILATTLALMGWNSYRQQEERWTRQQIDFSDDLRLDTVLVLSTIVLSLTSIAALSPTISLQRLADWTDRLSTAWGPPNRPGSGAQGPGAGEDAEPGLTFGESLGLAPGSQAPERTVLDNLRFSGGLPQEHLLGSGPELSEQIVLAVRDEIPLELPEQARYYWRAVTYDRYSGVGWATSPTQEADYAAEGRTLASGLTAQALARQEIQVFGEAFGGGAILFSPGELLAVSQAYQVAWRHLPQAPLDGSDQYGVLARPIGQAPDSYRIEALVSQASQEQLRSAGSRYPDWVLENDLTLPEALPNRVRRLALDLTATEPNPYDRALAIESFLRRYPYTLDLDEPPGDRDLVDYFLFDLERGYCDYYASAMVVLARAAGIPARLAVGYAGGSYDPESSRYLISAAEAHSWPELYFPTYGWIGFEPTAGRPALERTEQTTSLEPPQWSGERADFTWRVDWQRLGYGILGILGAALLGLMIWSVGEPWWLRRLPYRLALPKVYRRLYRSGMRLQVITYPGDTPGEFGAKLNRRLEQLQPGLAGITGSSLPDKPINDLVQAYSRLLYGAKPPEEALKERAIQDWQLVRERLWRARLASIFNKFR
jgi:hypothetical protein